MKAVKGKLHMENVKKVRWQNWTGETEENLTLNETKEGIFVESTITSKEKDQFSVTYTLVCDTLWRVKKITLALAEKKQSFTLESDSSGRWTDNSGVVPKLAGAIDVDISATPFTNTLPIHRLKLKENESKEILVVYVTVPDLTVSIDRQRYTCLIPNKRYRFEQIGTDFSREIEVDENGLVLDYPGLFRRIE